MAMRHVEVSVDPELRTIFAVMWDRTQVQAIAAAARHAGLDPAAVDLKSLCVARAIEVDSCILLDMSAKPCEAVLIDGRVPRAAHNFKLKAGSGGDLSLAVSIGLMPGPPYHQR